MQSKIKKLTPRLVIALLTFATGVALTLLWVASRFRPVITPRVPEASDTSKSGEVSLPEGWKTLEIKGAVVLQVPSDMEPSRLIGDSPSHREAYSNKDINITIVYGDPDPCVTPPFLLERTSYHEFVVDIYGKKAKLGIDRFYQPEHIRVHLCFLNLDDKGMQLRALVFCKDERALEITQMIFNSIRFKDTR